MTTDQLERELLKLSAADRARLAERLIASLNEDPEVEAAWKTEVRRRDAEREPGAVRAIPVEDALRTIRAKFGW
jgi:putative addiction module component (TIGR02574 family)